MAFTVNFPVDTGTFVITNYKDVDLSKPETLLSESLFAIILNLKLNVSFMKKW